ncbi:MAG: DNA primase [Alphaproteobacteria bacterium]|nr:DNA primase [Alphaproteobacteria bacterium]MDG2467493.1 DNA primase [Alphaproteobacteria bacterium]
MALPQQFMDELRRRVSLSSIISKKTKLINRGNRMVGLCPFHQEKTPSFHVRDDEGFYHCFGCGASGDAISFLREQEGLGFMDAIHHLAGLAGLTVPEQKDISPQEKAQRNSMATMNEDAAVFYQQQLNSPAGKQARRYLSDRQVSPNSLSRYRIGYAPASGLLPYLQARGFTPEDMLAAGLVRKSTRDGGLYDNFRHRLMFPIANPRGEVIAFGGRALDGDQEPKYLNSADSPMFHKKQVLYGLKQAREQMKDGLPVIVAEGYMDVIAIDQFKVAAAVAPLGTALTEDQIMLIWKSAPAPYLCFDGDTAGQRAANKTLTRILPILEPGKTVRVMRLEKGQDPDDLLKSGGADAMRHIMDASESLVDALWHSTAADFDLNEAEQRAKFWQMMRDYIRQVNNSAMRDSLGDEIHARIQAMRQRPRQNKSGQSYGQTTYIGRQHALSAKNIRPRAIMTILMYHPELIHDLHEELVKLDIKDDLVKKMLNIISESVTIHDHLDETTFRHHLESVGVGEKDQLSLWDSIKSRVRFDPETLSREDAKTKLDELITLEIRGNRARSTKQI